MIEVKHWPNGNIRHIEMRNEDDKYHNPSGPAYQAWYKNGQEQHRCYCVDGKMHNLSGPAIQKWYKNGQEYYREYWLFDKRHNSNGPARRIWLEDGKEIREYWVDGKELTIDEFNYFQDCVDKA